MPIEGAQALGDWESFPHRLDNRPVDTLGLSADEAQVLSAIDGTQTIEMICNGSTLGRNETLSSLFSLMGRGLIVVTQVGRSEPAPAAEMAALPPSPSGISTPGAARLEILPFRGVDVGDERVLKGYGPVGFIPGLPHRRPGQGRYGSYQFDKRALLLKCGLSVSEKREVIFLSQNLPRLDHFEFFDIEPTADRTEFKKAFFAFSKKYHPDARYQRDAGPFEPYIQFIYRHAREVNELWQSDERFRIVYARAVEGRNRAYREGLEAMREEQAHRKRQDRLALARDRKTQIQERLARNAKARRVQSNRGPGLERVNRAEKFYQDGMAQYQEGNVGPAANLLRLAVTYDPRNRVYAQAFEKIDREARYARAERIWAQGEDAANMGRVNEAIDHWSQAVELSRRADYAARLAQYLHEQNKDVRKAVWAAELAVASAPQDVDYLVLLATIYETAELVAKAAGALERALKEAPGDDGIKKKLKALKRH